MRLPPAVSPTLPLLACALLVLSGCASADPTPESPAVRPSDLGDTPASTTPATPAASSKTSEPRPPTGPAAGAVTHIGREVLPRADLVAHVRGVQISNPLHGTEIARVEVLEVFWGHTAFQNTELTVLCAQTKLLPRPGRECILLLDLRKKSRNAQVVQVIPFDDVQRTERVAALREYLLIEQLPQRADRFAALLDYLRDAVLASQEWTRWNAAEEYASLARAYPEQLGPEDVRVLMTARNRAERPALRALYEAALAAVSPEPRVSAAAAASASQPAPDGAPSSADTGSSADTAPPRPATADAASSADIGARLERFRDPALTADQRRQIVVDAVQSYLAAASPILAAALQDADPSVRETAAAAAGAVRAEPVTRELLALLESEPEPAVRTAAVAALGLLKASAAVPQLGALAAKPDRTGREAAFALARIRTDEALAQLRALLDGAQDEASRGLFDFLLSDEFVEAERSLDSR